MVTIWAAKVKGKLSIRWRWPMKQCHLFISLLTIQSASFNIPFALIGFIIERRISEL
jgi:hypothetical protein